MKFDAQVARKVAEELVERLTPACERIEIAGSLRRRKPMVGDIELVCIPKYDGVLDMLDQAIRGLMFNGVLDYRLNKGDIRTYGPKNKLLRHVPSGIGVDVFCTTPDCWAVTLFLRTGGAATNQRIATEALKRGWRFQAYGRGFTTPYGEVICHSEEDVFASLGLPYLPPERRP